MRPCIGITCGVNEQGRYSLPQTYVEAIQQEGGRVILLPPGEAIWPEVDGLLLPGGDDIQPHWWGEDILPGLDAWEPERDVYEIFLVREAWQRNVPLFGICRGMQVTNVALGGSLWQDIPRQCPNALLHRQEADLAQVSHLVTIQDGGGRLSCGELWVNSHHHQGIKKLASCLKKGAIAADGLVEAFYAPAKDFFWGVQWHPERLLTEPEAGRQLIHCFVQAGYHHFMAK